MKKNILLLVTLMGLTLSLTAFAGLFEHNTTTTQDKARIEEDKRAIAADRDKLRDASAAIQHDRQKLIQDQHQLDMDRRHEHPAEVVKSPAVETPAVQPAH